MSEGRFHYSPRAVDDTAAADSSSEEVEALESAEELEPDRYREEYTVSGRHVMSKVSKLLREGNVLSITVKDSSGNVYFEVPLVVGVIGTVLFPSIAALGFLGAFASNMKVIVERRVSREYSFEGAPEPSRRKIRAPLSTEGDMAEAEAEAEGER